MLQKRIFQKLLSVAILNLLIAGNVHAQDPNPCHQACNANRSSCHAHSSPDKCEQEHWHCLQKCDYH
jgi:hypothetical protein